MITRNSFGAAALAAALVFAPLMSAAARAAAPRAAVRQDDAPSQAEQDIFNRGRALFAKGQYEQAATVFRDFLKGHPDSFIADLMLLWLGRSYIELGRYDDADQVAQRLRTIKDTPFVDIYESELTAARRDRPASAVAAATPAPRATPTETAVVRPTPTPTPTRRVPALVRPAPTPTPTQVASANTSTTTPGLSVRGEGDAQRPRTTSQRPRRNSRRDPANSSSLNANTSAVPTATPRATPTPRTERTETTTNVVRPAVTPAPTPAPRPAETPTPVVNNVQASAGEGQSGFSITVTQVPDLQLALRRTALAAQPGQVIQLPLVITNSGNKEDQFRLETDLPAEYQPSFSQSGNDTSMPVFVTPTMTRGSSIEVVLNARVPENAPD
ncbi:MAG TPA: tetratricopeptide repeat protein, partial [Pyrinomonadaceae bacterium]|nr:tetratricopeptide repeat protein [Pyrinomonadaceae bacterium]